MLAPPVLRLAFRLPTGDQIRQILLSSLLFQDTMVLSPKTTRLLLLPVNESQELFSKVLPTRKENQLLILRDFGILDGVQKATTVVSMKTSLQYSIF